MPYIYFSFFEGSKLSQLKQTSQSTFRRIGMSISKSGRIYFLTGPCVASALGITIALKRNTVCLGHVLAVTVTVLFWALVLPLVSNLAFTKPVPPTGIGSLLQSGTVQPHEPCAP